VILRVSGGHEIGGERIHFATFRHLLWAGYVRDATTISPAGRKVLEDS